MNKHVPFYDKTCKINYINTMYINDEEGTDFDASTSGQFSPQQLHHFIYLTVGHSEIIL